MLFFSFLWFICCFENKVFDCSSLNVHATNLKTLFCFDFFDYIVPLSCVNLVLGSLTGFREAHCVSVYLFTPIECSIKT